MRYRMSDSKYDMPPKLEIVDSGMARPRRRRDVVRYWVAFGGPLHGTRFNSYPAYLIGTKNSGTSRCKIADSNAQYCQYMDRYSRVEREFGGNVLEILQRAGIYNKNDKRTIHTRNNRKVDQETLPVNACGCTNNVGKVQTGKHPKLNVVHSHTETPQNKSTKIPPMCKCSSSSGRGSLYVSNLGDGPGLIKYQTSNTVKCDFCGGGIVHVFNLDVSYQYILSFITIIVISILLYLVYDIRDGVWLIVRGMFDKDGVGCVMGHVCIPGTT